ncbi:MAG TPA: VWA domain-containing protein [bacterium]|jgi:Ca-activated chloride channel family protein|nr:VWA domain-containing protein [bacterium]
MNLGLNPSDLQNPQVLAWLPWLAALAALHLLLFLQQWWWQRRQFKSLALRRFGPGLSLWRGLLKMGLWCAAAWNLVLALAVPLGPPVKIEGKQYGADVILCVDVSSSMQAQDVQPNRLEAVKKALTGLLDSEGMQGDRVGLVAFAGGAVVACPLTTDYDTAELFLDKLDVNCVPRDGTDLASAIGMALDGFGTDSTRGKLIVLATDGEDTVNSDVIGEALRAKAAGVAIECVGIGTAAGALIPGQTDVFGRVYAKMWHGQPVRTKLDRAGLERIAAVSGGEYLKGDSEASLGRMVARVEKLKKGLGKAPDRYVREPLFEVPLLWALALLLADSLLSLRGRGWLRVWEGFIKFLGRRWHPGRVLLPLLCLLALAATARADLDDGRSDYNAGNDAYRSGDYSAAAEKYRQAAAAANLQEASDYNLGNALFQQRDYQGAVNAYDQALKIQPEDQDAQYNRDLAQQMLDKKNKPDKKNKKNDKKGQNKNQGGQQNGGQQQGGGQQQQNGGQQQGGPPQQSGGQQPSPGQGQQDSSGQPEPSPSQAPPGPRLNRDQIETMLNQLKNDQHKYEGAFNPLKHYGNKPPPEDPAQQFLEQFGGLPRPSPTPPPDPDYKDW